MTPSKIDPQLAADIRDIRMFMDRMSSTLSGIGMTLWGPLGNPYTEDALKSAKEVADKFREKRQEDLKRSLEDRVRDGKSDPDVWDADDEMASQMS